MNVRAARVLCVSLFFGVLSSLAVALPGDASAVLAHCGPPSSDQVLHQDSPHMERVISYSDIQLSFNQENSDWSFTRAYRAGIVLPQNQLFATMHCVSDALEEVSAAPPATLAAATPTETASANSEAAHEKIFIWIAVIVFATVFFFAVRPYMRSEQVRPPAPVPPRAPQRRPSAIGIKFRRPEEDNPSGIHRIPRNDSTNQD